MADDRKPISLRRDAAPGRSQSPLPRTRTMSFSIASELLQSLQDHIRGYGLRDAESGGFLLGPYDASTATLLALAEGVGIERSRGMFRVSGKAIGLTDLASDGFQPSAAFASLAA